MIDPCYDATCMAKLGSTQHLFATKFHPNAGPNLAVMDKKCTRLEQIAEEVVAQLEEQRRLAEQGKLKGDKSALKEAASHKIQAGIKRAKVAAAARRSEPDMSISTAL